MAKDEESHNEQFNVGFFSYVCWYARFRYQACLYVLLIRSINLPYWTRIQIKPEDMNCLKFISDKNGTIGLGYSMLWEITVLSSNNIILYIKLCILCTSLTGRSWDIRKRIGWYPPPIGKINYWCSLYEYENAANNHDLIKMVRDKTPGLLLHYYYSIATCTADRDQFKVFRLSETAQLFIPFHFTSCK